MSDDQDLPPGVRQMLADAKGRELVVEVRPRPAANSLAEAAQLLGIEPADIAKTLVCPPRRRPLSVAMGAGSHGFSAFVDVDDLVRAYDATVADIAG